MDYFAQQNDATPNHFQEKELVRSHSHWLSVQSQLRFGDNYITMSKVALQTGREWYAKLIRPAKLQPYEQY